MKPSSLCQVLQHNQTTEHGIFFVQSQGEDRYVSYQDLYHRALRLLSFLQGSGVAPGQELIFQIDNNEDFVSLFWACLLGGIIPVPLSVGNNDEHRLKLFRIWKILNNPHLISDSKVMKMLTDFGSEADLSQEMEVIASRTLYLDKFEANPPSFGKIHPANLNDIAFIQFSSGSTGAPKGVIVTHDNLLVNIYAMIHCSEVTSQDISMSWMPLTHDMGLIGFHLLGVAAGITQVNMPTPLFIRHPTLWFKKVNQYKASVLYSPNFGFKHFLTFFDPKIAADWDLSRVRIIFNGAEPISAELCDIFLEKMGKHGMRRSAMYPVYGMAEATLATTFPVPGEVYTAVHVDRRYLNVGELIRELEPDSPENKVTFVDVGYPVDHCLVRITDNENRVLGDNTIGNIQISGTSVTQGYYNNQEITRKTITEDGWLNTGDLGFTRHRRLIVTGRAKDIIFVRGQNYYPHDIERVAEEMEGIELGKVAACGVFNAETQTEEVCLFFLFKKQVEDALPMIIGLKEIICQKTGLPLYMAIPVKKLPKTTSGKIQRYKLSEGFEQGEFAPEIQKITGLLRSPAPGPETQQRRSGTEQNLIKICEDVLKVTQIGLRDNLTVLGIDSLKLVQIHDKLESIYPGKVSVADFYAYPTVAGLAGLIDRGGAISIAPITLPPDYFSAAAGDQDQASFEFQLQGALLERITDVSKEENVSVSDILLAMYIYLLSETTGSKEITLQAMVDEPDRIFSFQTVLSQGANLTDLFKLVSREGRAQNAFVYSVADLDRIKLSREKAAIIPLFYRKDLFTAHPKLGPVYHLIFEFQETAGGIDFVVEYHPRISKGKIREFIDAYIKLLGWITEN